MKTWVFKNNLSEPLMLGFTRVTNDTVHFRIAKPPPGLYFKEWDPVSMVGVLPPGGQCKIQVPDSIKWSVPHADMGYNVYFDRAKKVDGTLVCEFSGARGAKEMN